MMFDGPERSAPTTVRHGGPGRWTATVADGPELGVEVLDPPPALRLRIDGVDHRFVIHALDDSMWIGGEAGDTWLITAPDVADAEDGVTGGGSGVLRAPMPGRVTMVSVAVGDDVHAGQTLAVVEAMKMEYALTAAFDGAVTEIHATAGAQVALHQPIVTVSGGHP
jgi:acetyl/propionyl-CoA carboxylase alpha subunit